MAGKNELGEPPRAGSEKDHHTMRTVLDAVMTQVPVSHATPGFKAHLAEVILHAAAQGVTSYDGLVAAASDQIQTIISMLT